MLTNLMKVMKAFSSDDYAFSVKGFKLGMDLHLMQYSLGLL